nr:branched-chain amino acid ABC transporter substrate-binding protein [Desulfobulbaceae bacterium]
MLNRTVFLVVCFVLLFGVQSYSAETIKIGVPGAHSGDLASYGLPTIKAVELVVKEINAGGGVNGRQVEIYAEDDACKPEVATNAATKLVSMKVDAIVGHICSGATKAAMGIYKNANLVAISPSATNPELTQSGDYPNFFRTIASDDLQASTQVDFILNNLKLTKIAVVHDKQDYGKGLAEFAKQFIEKSGRAQVVLFEGVTSGAVDYSAIVQKIKRSKAEIVLYGGYHPEASKIITQMRKKKMKTLFISGDGVKADTFIKVAAQNAEGIYATGQADTSQNSVMIKAKNDLKKVYGEDPGNFFENAYSAALALLNAIDKADSTDYDKLVHALRSEYVETPVGKISFDKHGDAIGVGFSVYQVRNSAFVEVK